MVWLVMTCPGTAWCRRSARGWNTSAVSTVRPVIQFSRPRRTTSTSGSSGIGIGTLVDHLPDGRPRGLGGLLLGLLLAPALTRAVGHATHPYRGAEGLLVVRAPLCHLVLGHAELLRCGQLLQRSLPAEA